MKLYYIVKGATKGDNVGEFEAKDEKEALAVLEKAYAANLNGFTLEIITKDVFESEGKRIYDERLKEAVA